MIKDSTELVIPYIHSDIQRRNWQLCTRWFRMLSMEKRRIEKLRLGVFEFVA